jgi:hypothetical protein
MTSHQPPRLALALLESLVPGSAPLAGDLVEEYGRRPSRLRVWREVLTAIAAAWRERSDEIRPLRLVDLQPQDAIERTRRLARHLEPINMAGSPLHGVGGLSLAVFLVLLTFVAPGAWWLVTAAVAAGVLLGVLMIAAHRTSIG